MVVLKLIYKSEIRRRQTEGINFDELRGLALELFPEVAKAESFTFKYHDDEGDLISIGSDFELKEALRLGGDVLRLEVSSKSSKKDENANPLEQLFEQLLPIANSLFQEGNPFFGQHPQGFFPFGQFQGHPFGHQAPWFQPPQEKTEQEEEVATQPTPSPSASRNNINIEISDSEEEKESKELKPNTEEVKEKDEEQEEKEDTKEPRTELERRLFQLEQMGFLDREKTTRLLIKNRLNLNATVEQLLLQ